MRLQRLREKQLSKFITVKGLHAQVACTITQRENKNRKERERDSQKGKCAFSNITSNLLLINLKSNMMHT